MRYGAFVPQGWRMDLVGVPVERQWSTMMDVARRIESSAAYESLWVYDHFHTVPQPTQEPTYECWTLMSAFAAATETVRLGQMCTCNSYRMPSLLAKIASCVDVISGGRLEFAIGAGWYEQEYRAYGYEFPRAGVRLAQLREAVQIITRMWTEDEVWFEGEHYRLEGAINQPKPLQRPRPPLWIAGGGEKVTLRIVAEFADWANFAGDLETFVHKKAILEEHCRAVGRDPEEIGLSSHLEFVVASTEEELRAKAERVGAQRGQDPERILARRYTGTPEQLVPEVQALRDAGCEYLIAYFPDAVWGDGLELFADEVVPAVEG